jgi:hypothetical protein
VYGELGLCTANKKLHLPRWGHDSHTGVQALQALNRSMFEKFDHCKAIRTDDDMVFMNIALVENAALHVGAAYLKKPVFMLPRILLIAWKGHLYCGPQV